MLEKLSERGRKKMADYKIITGSTADLTKELIKELDVDVIPYHFTLDEKEYAQQIDNSEMDIPTFYAKLKAGSVATTAQVNSETFVELFTPYLEKGTDILYVGFSSGLSGTYQSSLIAKAELEEKFPERKIYCIDTLGASMGQGLMVFYVAKMQQDGATIDEAAQWLKDNIFKLAHWFTVDDLFFLKRGGRVSAATAVVGTVLGIKPILHVDNEGHLIARDKTRGRKSSLDHLVKKMAETVVDPENQTVFISHGDAKEDAEYVRDQIKKKLGVKNFHLNYIGPIIGSHSGPGTIALFYIADKR